MSTIFKFTSGNASWRINGVFHADAGKVAEEIMGISDSPTAEEIVERARDSESELHKCFTWDDTEAARKYRIVEAQKVARMLVIKPREGEKEKPALRLFHVTENKSGYQPITRIVRIEEEYEKLLKRAIAELTAFKNKYAKLTELRELFDTIDELIA